MNLNFLIYPVHLFNIKILKENVERLLSSRNVDVKDINPKITFILIEEPCYFGFHREKMNFNKLKLLLHRASMKYYENLLLIPKTKKELKLKYDVKYFDFETIEKHGYTDILKCNELVYFDVVDFFLENKLSSITKGHKDVKITILENPGFLDTNEDLKYYHTKINKSKSFYHASFYKWQKSKLDLLEGVKSYDVMNRDKLEASVEVPSLYKNDNTTKWIKEGKKYIEDTFSSNIGSVKDGLKVPITHKTTIEWVKIFCKERFKYFGKYEDAIDVSRNFLFHSCISPMLNIGLITPLEVLEIINDYYNSHKTEIGIANYEGFIRQLIGWREYQRYIYRYAYDKMINGNHFKNTRELGKSWYEGTTGIEPVDLAIKMAFRDGYIHHILRLMVIGNVMNLSGVSPLSAYKWFMEFAIDSYDWVMIGNVYSMAFWADGGLTMRKPYISGDSYIMKMSNFKKGDWNVIWNSLFHHFIGTHRDTLKHTFYAGLVKFWDKMKPEDKARINEKALTFINSNTRDK